jgi:MinD-like ATPase involved in chromosome partitioning or flagellar assembly
MKFAEDVVDSDISPQDATVSIAPGADLLATGTAWSVFGPPNDIAQERLTERLQAGPWSDWIVDLGPGRPHRHHPIWRTCKTIAVILQDDLAGVTRTYALVRHLLACGWGDRLGLVYNRVTDSEQVEKLRRHFDQVTKAFLKITVPVIGVVPEGTAARRAIAVRHWATPAKDGGIPVPGARNRVSAPLYATETTL